MLRKCTIHGESAQETSAARAQEKIRPLRNRRKSASRREGSTTVQSARKQVKGNTCWIEALQPPERGGHRSVEPTGWRRWEALWPRTKTALRPAIGKGRAGTGQQLEAEEATAVRR